MFSEYRGLRKEMYVLCIGRMMTNMGTMIYPMLTLILNKKLGMSAGTIAIYMTLFSIIALPVSLIGGKLADKTNKKWIIIICDCISISTYLFCSTRTVSMPVLCVFAAGALFQMVEWPAYDALVADITTSKDRERAYSLQYLGSNLGLVLSPTIGGLLFENHLQLAFLINGLAIASSTLLIAIFLKNIQREKSDEPASNYEAELEENADSLQFILNTRVVLIFIIGIAISEAVYSMFGYLMPLTMGELHGARGSVLFGTMNSVNCFIVVAFTALITKWFSKLHDVDKMFTGEMLIISGFTIFTLFAVKPALCYVSMIIFTFGEIFMTLAAQPFLTRRIPASHRGRIMSVSNVGRHVGSAVFQLIIGQICDFKGIPVGWMTVIAVGLMNLIVITVLRRLDRKDFPIFYNKI